MVHVVTLPDTGDFEVWREKARAAVERNISPEEIVWQVSDGEPDLFAGMGGARFEGEVQREVRLKPSALSLLRDVICHRASGRFALAYRVLWRLQDEPTLLNVMTDPDVAEARLMVHQVRRAAHKMTAFVRFREDGISEDGRRRFLSWFEPDHHVLEKVAGFFSKRFVDMDWVILTPLGSLAWDGERVMCSFEPCEKRVLEDDVEALWRTYYASTFNPARVRTKAMRNEMPRRYWKNLPEAALIPSLVAEAERRVQAMADQEVLEAPAFHQAIRRQGRGGAIEAVEGLEALAREIRACRECALQCHATQAVVGEGVQSARVMMIGEQPGDQEDLAGRPFVGPAGQLLRACLAEAGVSRDALYLTNAVKHFRFEVKGRRRIHQTPGVEHVKACQVWLRQEMALVQPDLVVTLGATALRAVEGPASRLKDVRGVLREGVGGEAHLALAHPSWILRLGPTEQAERERQALVEGLSRICDYI